MTNTIESITSKIDETILSNVFQNWTQGAYSDNINALASALGTTSEEAEIIGQNWYDNN